MPPSQAGADEDANQQRDQREYGRSRRIQHFVIPPEGCLSGDYPQNTINNQVRTWNIYSTDRVHGRCSRFTEALPGSRACPFGSSRWRWSTSPAPPAAAHGLQPAWPWHAHRNLPIHVQAACLVRVSPTVAVECRLYEPGSQPRRVNRAIARRDFLSGRPLCRGEAVASMRCSSARARRLVTLASVS